MADDTPILSFKFFVALLSEFLGTMLLIIFACGSVSSATKATSGGATITQVALAFGFTITVLIQTFGRVSHSFFNPAITIAFVVTGKVKVVTASLFVLSQIVGAIVGAAILDAVTGRDELANLGITTLGTDVSSGEGFGIELIATFFFTFGIFAAVDVSSADFAALHIGLTLAACHFFAIPFTGCSVNPARSFGPALVANEWDDHWVYWIGPIVGACLGALSHAVIFDKDLKHNKTADATEEQP
eukprot:m.45918 g.45918  ORF g.45918 m.45918 type:complete len:244 (-) comp17467_c0_seq1:87-818(-)